MGPDADPRRDIRARRRHLLDLGSGVALVMRSNYREPRTVDQGAGAIAADHWAIAEHYAAISGQSA